MQSFESTIDAITILEKHAERSRQVVSAHRARAGFEKEKASVVALELNAAKTCMLHL